MAWNFSPRFYPLNFPLMTPITSSMEAPKRAASGVTLKQAVASLLFAKASANYRPRYVKSLRQYLALFAGIRPEELEKIGWESVDLAAGKVRVDAAASKVRRRRIVHLMPNALEWLAFSKELGAALPYSRSSRCRALARAARRLGFSTWPQDVLRHSAASYLMTHTRDVGRVADDLGNSPSILLRHYRELVTTENALAFWNLIP